MKTSVQLKQERKGVTDKIEALKAKAASENNRSYTDDEVIELQSLVDSENKLGREIELALELEAREARMAGAAGTKKESSPEEREIGEFSFGKMLRELASGKGLTGREAELVQESEKEAERMGVSPTGIYLSDKILNVKHKRSTMVSGTGNLGGDLIPTEKVGFFDALYAQTQLENLGVPKLTGLTANTDLPGFSSGVTVVWETETGANDELTPAVANKTLRPKRLGGYSSVSKTLLMQTNGSIENYLMQTYIKALASGLEAAFVNGSGSAPTGILGTSGTSLVTIDANGGAITYAKILEVVQTLGTANVNMNDLKWLTNFKVASKLKQTPIVSGQAAMVLAYQQYYTGTPNVIDGMPVYLTSNVPSNLTKGSTGTNLSAIILGDWANNSIIGQFGGIDIVVDPYTSAKNNTVEIIVNQFVDIAFKQPAAFGIIKDATT